jgi:hypothetical protein
LNPLLRSLLVFFTVLIAEVGSAPYSSDSVAGSRQDTAGGEKKIVAISFNGNKTTRANVLRMFLNNFGVAVGTTYDTMKVDEIKRKLLMTNLFDKIEVVVLTEGDGIHLYFIIQEIFYWFPTLGFEYIEKTDRSESWPRYSWGLQKRNFCGRMESASLSGTVWREKSLGLSWNKPLLPSKYSIGIGGSAAYFPELNYPRQRIVIRGRVDAARDLTVHSRGFASIVPSYSIIDTLMDQPFSLQRIHEAYSIVGWSTDYRNSNFDPVSGWCVSNEFLSNAFYSDDAIKYGQYSCDFRFYVPGLLRRHRVACNMRLLLRSNTGGPYRRLYAGGENSVRGFPRDFLGMTDEMNNRAFISAEYRFPIATIPVGDFVYQWIPDKLLPLLEKFPELKDLYYQIDGSLIADAVHLWNKIDHPLTRRQGGEGIGAGIRLLFPTLRRSVCFDVVWPILNGRSYSSPWPQGFHVYLDMHY